MTPADRNGGGGGDGDGDEEAGGEDERVPAQDADIWRAYWADVLESGRRLQVENAAADPLGRWLVAEVPTLVDEHGIGPETLRADPDGALAAARRGFEELVNARDLPGYGDERYGYGALPVHLTAVGRVRSVPFALEDPAADANALVTLDGASVVDDPTRRHEAAVLTYRCPRGHETTVRQPLLRTWTVETCGDPGCEQGIVPDDARTRGRHVARFTVDGPDGALPCVATGREAADGFDRLASARRLHLTGIVRLLVDGSGALEPTVEVLAAEPTAP